MAAASSSEALPGLEVVLDKLEHLVAKGNLPPGYTHVFVYHLTIRNHSARTVTLLGRKWIVVEAGGDRTVIEGDKIVGQSPHLRPGESFSYNSFHVTAGDSEAEGSFHGVDEDGTHIHTVIPRIAMRVPEDEGEEQGPKA